MLEIDKDRRVIYNVRILPWYSTAMKCCLLVACGLVTTVFAETRTTKTPVIERITIPDRAAKSEDPNIDCDSLRMDEKRVRYFLRHAKPISQLGYARAYEMGSCGVSAIVRFKGGREVRLAIDDGTGWGMTVHKRSITYLYCEACTDLLEPDFDFKEPERPL